MRKCYFLVLSLSLNFISIDFFGQTVWSGPTITFSKADGASPTAQSNQDRITANVWLTRGGTTGIYNAVSESAYTGTSPANTEWAHGSINNYASLTYSTWVAWHGKNPPSSINKDAVLHLISENIYIGIKFISWSQSANGGGFSYQRTIASILPVTLKNFGASLQNGQALLQWKTATEINNQYFEVERSTDGINFSAVGRVTGNGSSGIEHTYIFKDNTAAPGTYYYRLAQHDLDGTIRYSSIIRLSQKFSVSLVLLPNPSGDFVKVITSNSVEGSMFSITTALGQTMKTGIMSTQKIDVRDLPSGHYWITIRDDSGKKTQASFIKK